MKVWSPARMCCSAGTVPSRPLTGIESRFCDLSAETTALASVSLAAIAPSISLPEAVSICSKTVRAVAPSQSLTACWSTLTYSPESKSGSRISPYPLARSVANESVGAPSRRATRGVSTVSRSSTNPWPCRRPAAVASPLT